MTDASKSQKKDTKGTRIEQFADTQDPFVNAIYKKLRSKKKKLDKIKDTEDKAKKGDNLTQE